MVASKRNPGKGINGIKEPKKLTRTNPKYPTSVENGNRAVISTNQATIRLYLIKSTLPRLGKSILESLKYHLFTTKIDDQQRISKNL